jgi:hypothetical protein
MLPHTAKPQLSRSRIRTWIQRLDSYSLWAFNAQPPLVRRRPTDRAHDWSDLDS